MGYNVDLSPGGGGEGVGMALLRTLLAVSCAAVAAGAAALPADASTQVKRPVVMWQGGTQNYTPANRQPRHIKYVVIHVAEGSFWGSVEWLKNPDAEGSSHYVVGRKGDIVQLVREKDVAWHAGNKRLNELSTGIEHAGMTYDPVGFTRAQYEASARLTAYIARRSLMPITRQRIIGHHEVPNPIGPGHGGADKHTDPGPYWDWNLYLKLVRRYAFPPNPVNVASTTIYSGQTIAGSVPWRAKATGPGVRRVDFLVDGKLRWRSATAPHVFAPGRGLNTTAMRNGRHTLELRAYGAGGKLLRTRKLTVVVRNAAFELTTAGLKPGQQVSGVLEVRANTRVAPALRAELLVNGRPVSRDGKAPFRLRWDARRAKPGPYKLQVRATAKDGRVATRTVRVVVPKRGAPATPAPAPPPSQEVPAPVLLGQMPGDGSTVSGVVDWRPQMTGRVVRVEFLVDGVLRHKAEKAPFRHEWDTAAEAPGEHVLTVRLVGPTGKVAEGSVTVTVAPPTP